MDKSGHDIEELEDTTGSTSINKEEKLDEKQEEDGDNSGIKITTSTCSIE